MTKQRSGLWRPQRVEQAIAPKGVLGFQAVKQLVENCVRDNRGFAPGHAISP